MNVTRAGLVTVTALFFIIAIEVEGTMAQDGGQQSSIAQIAKQRGRQFKVTAKAEMPSLIAVRVRHDQCPICISIEGDLDPALDFLNQNRVLVVTIDLSSEATLTQAGLLIASLGLEALWPEDFSGMGSVTLVERDGVKVLGSVQTDDVGEIEAFLHRTVAVTGQGAGAR